MSRNYIVIISDGLFGLHGSTQFSYARSGQSLQYTFQAEIPLA